MKHRNGYNTTHVVTVHSLSTTIQHKRAAYEKTSREDWIDEAPRSSHDETGVKAIDFVAFR